MAKKVNIDPIPSPELVGEENIPPAELNTPVEVKSSESESAATPDPQVMQVLRAYSGYEKLYVDKHGGAYTSDTPVLLRKEAILYINPFYKPFNTKN